MLGPQMSPQIIRPRKDIIANLTCTCTRNPPASPRDRIGHQGSEVGMWATESFGSRKSFVGMSGVRQSGDSVNIHSLYSFPMVMGGLLFVLVCKFGRVRLAGLHRVD